MTMPIYEGGLVAADAPAPARPQIVDDPSMAPGEVEVQVAFSQPVLDTPQMRAEVAAYAEQAVRGAIATAERDYSTSGTAQTIVWRQWNNSAATTGNYYFNSDYSTTVSNNIWTTWSSDQIVTIRCNATTAASSTFTWNEWVTDQDARTNARTRVKAYEYPVQSRAPFGARVPAETEAQRLERLAQAELRRQQYEREAAVSRERRAMAIGRADKLLESVLSGVQRAQLEKNDWFLVRGESGLLYRIRKGRSANVDVVDPKTGKVVDVLCAYPRMDVPDGDCMVAQKLMLECDEESFRKIAIRHQPRGEVPLAAVAALLH